MLSDVLYEAIDGIEHYQSAMPDIYDSNKHHIEYVKRELVRLSRYYDGMPGTQHIFTRLPDDTEATTEKMALDMAARYLESLEARDKMAGEAMAETGLTREELDKSNPSPEIIKKTQIFHQTFERNIAKAFPAPVKS